MKYYQNKLKSGLVGFKKLSPSTQISLLITVLLLFTIGITINNALTRQEKRTRAASNNVSAYNTPTPTCSPRPACLDATPQCSLPEPTNGWCEKKSTLGESSYIGSLIDIASLENVAAVPTQAQR